MSSVTPAASLVNVTKRYGDAVALDGVDLEVGEGSVWGLLGPNGAGKTTIVRMLATLLRPDSGRARVFGHDVVNEAPAVRRLVGLTGQFAAVDELLTGRENLRMFGRLFHLDARTASRRADELLEGFDLVDAADRYVHTYSGGMRRRLDLASSLLVRPRLLFLDEPTTGLDPHSRGEIWGIVRDLVQRGTTLLLTTQYLEEADQLADGIAVIDHGTIIARGTADELKDRVGGQMIEVRLRDPGDRDRACKALTDLGCGPPPQEQAANGFLALPAEHDDVGMLAEAARALQQADVAVAELGLRRPTLDDVFLRLTGQRAADSGPDEEKR